MDGGGGEDGWRAEILSPLQKSESLFTLDLGIIKQSFYFILSNKKNVNYFKKILIHKDDIFC